MGNKIIIAACFVTFMAFTLLLPWPTFAAENESLDEIIGGFDDDTQQTAHGLPSEEVKPSAFSLNGNLKLGASYNFAHDKPEGNGTDWRGLSRLCTKLSLELNAKLSSAWQARISGKGTYDFAYAIRGRDEFTDDVLDNYEKELELGETYVQGSLTKNFDIKIGRQIVVWGKI